MNKDEKIFTEVKNQALNFADSLLRDKLLLVFSLRFFNCWRNASVHSSAASSNDWHWRFTKRSLPGTFSFISTTLFSAVLALSIYINTSLPIIASK